MKLLICKNKYLLTFKVISLVMPVLLILVILFFDITDVDKSGGFAVSNFAFNLLKKKNF